MMRTNRTRTWTSGDASSDFGAIEAAASAAATPSRATRRHLPTADIRLDCRSAGRRRGRREAEQALGHVAAQRDQLVERVLEVAVADDDAVGPAVVGREQRGLAQQLPDEGRAGALRSLEDLRAVAELQGQAGRIERQQAI